MEHFCRMTKHEGRSGERGVIYDATRIRLNYGVQSSHVAGLFRCDAGPSWVY